MNFNNSDMTISRKHMNDKNKITDDFLRVAEVASSCTSEHHVDSARNLLKAFIVKWIVGTSKKKSKHLYFLCTLLELYLRHTKEHCLNGCHIIDESLPPKNEFPDIRDYLGDFLPDIKTYQPVR